MRKRGFEAKRALDEYSKLLGREVRHLGYWKDTTAAEVHNLKRSTESDDHPLPAFGSTTHGHDLHLVHCGVVDGQQLVRFCFNVDELGDELEKRNRKDFFFENGGLDFRFNPLDPQEPGWWKGTDEQFG